MKLIVMFDFLRNLTKSAEEKEQEALHAYLDDALSPKEKQAMAGELSRDESLQAEFTQYRLLQNEMRQMPRRRVPRNFTLDPERYGRPRSEPLLNAYPVLRTATVLAAVFFVFAFTINVFLSASPASQPETSESIVMDFASEIEEEAAPTFALEQAVEEEIVIEAPAEEVVVETQVEEIRPADGFQRFSEEESEQAVIAEETLDALGFDRLAQDSEEEEFAAPSSPALIATTESLEAESLPIPTPESEIGGSADMQATVITSAEAPMAAAESQPLDADEITERVDEPLTLRQQPDQSNTFRVLFFVSGLILFILLVLTLLARQRF